MYLIIEFLDYAQDFDIYNTIEELKEEVKRCRKDDIHFEIYEIKKEIKENELN